MTRTSFISSVTILASLAVGGIAFRSWLEARDDRLQMQATLNTQKQLIASAQQQEQQHATELRDTLAQIAALKRHVQTPEQIIRELPQYLPLPEPIQLAPTGSQLAAPAPDGGPAQQGSSAGAPKRNTLNGASHYGEPDAPKPQPPKMGANVTALSRGNVPALGEPNMPPVGRANLSAQSEADVPAPHLPSRKEPTGIDALPGAIVGKPVFTAQNEAKLPPAVQFPVEDLKPLYDFVQDCRACKAQLDAARADLSDERAKSAALTKERDAAIKAVKGGSFWSRLKRNAEWFALGTGIGVALAHAPR